MQWGTARKPLGKQAAKMRQDQIPLFSLGLLEGSTALPDKAGRQRPEIGNQARLSLGGTVPSISPGDLGKNGDGQAEVGSAGSCKKVLQRLSHQWPLRLHLHVGTCTHVQTDFKSV